MHVLARAAAWGAVLGGTLLHASAALFTSVLGGDAPGAAFMDAYGMQGLPLLVYHVLFGTAAGAFLGVILKRQFESELHAAELRGQLTRSQRLEAVGHLAAGVSHDVNNVLSAVSMRLSLAHKTTGPDQAEHLKKARQLIERASELPQRVLGYARTDPGHEAATAACVAAAVDLVRPALGKSVAIDLDLDEVPTTYLNPRELEQIVVNLLINARDAMDGSGTIQIHLTQAGANVRLTIQDDGPGIPDSVRQQMFDPLFTTKGDKGTGLGLSTCRLLVHEADGDIRVENTKPGARFTIELPVNEAHG